MDAPSRVCGGKRMELSHRKSPQFLSAETGEEGEGNGKCGCQALDKVNVHVRPWFSCVLYRHIS